MQPQQQPQGQQNPLAPPGCPPAVGTDSRFHSSPGLPARPRGSTVAVMDSIWLQWSPTIFVAETYL